MEEQQEKEARALKAVQRAQKLLATQASMSQTRSSATDGSSSARGTSAAGPRGGSAAAGGGSALVAELAQDIQLAEARLVTRSMLQELRILALQHPGELMPCTVLAALRPHCTQQVVGSPILQDMLLLQPATGYL